jgi:hypothetical protein
MEVIKKRKAPSHDRKPPATTEQAAEPSLNTTISRPQSEVVSNTEERTTATGRRHSV